MITPPSKSRTIAWVGYMLEHYVDDDLIDFIKNVNHDFLFIVNPGDNNVVNKLKHIEKVSVRIEVDAGELINLVKSCRYLLCRKFPYQKDDRFSGALSLGVSCGIPLLIQKKQAEDYDLPGLVFDSHYTEMVDQINTIEKKDYIELVDKIKHKGEELMSSNNKMVQEFVQKTFSSTEIILVCIKSFQEYIKSNIEQLLDYGNVNITVITDREFFHEFDNIPVKLVDASTLDVNEFNEKSQMDKEYRNGFWESCSKRLFLIQKYMENNNVKNVIHLENDVLLYCEADELYGKIPDKSKMYVVVDSEVRGIPGILYIPDHQVLGLMTYNYDWGKNDMENLYLAWRKFKEIKLFPIYHMGVNEFQQKISESFCDFGCVFDGAAIGQYLGGIDIRNLDDLNKNTRGFVNETCVIDYSGHKFYWVYVSNNRHEPYIEMGGKLVKIMNLHIHSKKLHKFMSKHVSELMYIDFYD